MRSSTSSSDASSGAQAGFRTLIGSPDARAPGGHWGVTWLLALALAVAAVWKLEHAARDRGYRPSVVDDMELWSSHRARVSNGRHDVVALLGASRIQLGFSTAEFRAQFPNYRIAQLAVDGTRAGATLRDLANDDQFRGVAIVAVAEGDLMTNTWERQQPWVDYYHEQRSPGLIVNRMIATRVQARFAILAAGGGRLLRTLVTRRRWPPAIYLVTHADRSRSADYTLIDVARQRERRVAPLRRRMQRGNLPEPVPERWLTRSLAIERLVAPIQARGGQVVFVRMPTSGEHIAYTEAVYPKREFWDRFAARTSAETVHFLDYPSLSRFECPDSSHLDQRDAPAFTSALLAILVDRGVLARPEGGDAKRAGQDPRSKEARR